MESDDQMVLDAIVPQRNTYIDVVVSEAREFVSSLLTRNGLPGDAARYLVAFDKAEFQSAPPSDLLFAFDHNTVPLSDEIDAGSIGFKVSALLEPFSISRLFVPAKFSGEVREFLDGRYRIRRGLGV